MHELLIWHNDKDTQEIKRNKKQEIFTNCQKSKRVCQCRPNEVKQVGFITQLKGNLTKKRYKYATVFVDHYSKLSYVFLQSTITSEKTLRAKRAFEA